MDVKFIKRYAFIYRGFNLPAGVYTATVSIAIVVGSFPITITEVWVSGGIHDSITDQNIQGSFDYTIGFDSRRDNPGIVGNNLIVRVASNLGGPIYQKVHLSLGPGETLSGSFVAFSNTVTANVLAGTASIRVGYLCPEDYLSIEALAANP